jgi:hypothetical protein
MPYIINNTNGVTVATVEDGSVDNTTSLTFVGKNYSGYGQIENENLLHLLENFASGTKPITPVQGQLWFDTSSSNRRLNVCYDGKNFKSIANLENQRTDPSLTMTPLDGDLWWDASTKQLKAWIGSLGSWSVIGPESGATAVANWAAVSELSPDGKSHPVLKGYVNGDPIVVLSGDSFDPVTTSDLYFGFSTGVQTGLNLKRASESGSTQLYETYFWGTAADALTANTATTVKVTTTASGTFYLPFVSTSSGSQPLFTTGTISYNVLTQVLNATATSARYADLAERYAADAVYEPGTVLVIGGVAEVTTTREHADTSVAGIVSTNPAYMMNNDAGNDETHPYIALKGRVPCKVVGKINKGELLVTSYYPGYAEAWAPGDNPNAVIGKALGSQSEGYGLVEVMVI